MNKFKLQLKKIDFTKIKYFNTFFVAFLLALAVVITASIHARMSIDDELYITKESQSKLKRKFTESILSQEEALGKIYSDDYKYNIYIAGLNQSIGNFEKAEFYYKRAIYLAPMATYEHYLKLIALYLEYDKPQKAEEIESTVDDKSDQKLIKFKCNANILLGDYYYKHNEAKLANKKYTSANFYFNKLKRRVVRVREYIENGLLASNTKIADGFVKEQNYLEAYRYLKKAEKNAPDSILIKYKLALVLSHINPMKAIEYFDYIKVREPQNISFYLYYETLMRAAEISKIRGNMPEAKLYTYKASSAKSFYENNVVNPDVINFDFIHSKIQTSKKSDKFSLKFRVTNATSQNIYNLQMDTIFLMNGKPVAKFNQTLYDKDKMLHVGETSPVININYNAPQHYKKIEYPKVSFEIYLYKNPKYKYLFHKGDFSGSLVTEF